MCEASPLGNSPYYIFFSNFIMWRTFKIFIDVTLATATNSDYGLKIYLIPTVLGYAIKREANVVNYLGFKCTYSDRLNAHYYGEQN